MDSRKFRKVGNNTGRDNVRKGRKRRKRSAYVESGDFTTHRRQSGHRRKRGLRFDFKNILVFFGALVVVCGVVAVLASSLHFSSVPEGAVLVYPSEFNLTPYGYDWNKDLYGYCDGVDESGSRVRYYFTLEQMAALYKRSHESFNYSDGIYVTLSNESDSRARIAGKVYNSRGHELIKPYYFDEQKFLEDARFIGRNNTFCSKGFGFTAQEYRDSSF